MSKKLPTNYQSFIHKSRYSRWVEKEKRREEWDETVDRYVQFVEEHLKENYDYSLPNKLKNQIRESILNLEVMPSMRAMMSAGEALKRDNLAAYNCSYIAVRNQKVFSEILYILMNGTGAGFSVERQYVNQLPDLPSEIYDTETIIKVRDSKIGWAKALKELIALLYTGQCPKYDLSKIRPKGSILKTFGGRASGPEPLDKMFRFVIHTFKQAVSNNQKKLSSIQCHDILCHIGNCVVVGGVRRCIFYKYRVLLDNYEWKQISELKVGDKVLFENKPVTILDVINNGEQETLEINLESGKKHICTPEHRWFVYNHDSKECEWVETEKLQNGNYSMLELKDE